MDTRALSKSRGEAPASESPGGTEGKDVPASPGEYRPVFTCAIDDVAYAALRSCQGGAREDQQPRQQCELCEAPLQHQPGDEPQGVKGLLMWSRGDDDVRFEEPVLCTSCATAIGVSALARWQLEEEEEG